MIKLKDLEKGDYVWCGGDSGFCNSAARKVSRIMWRFNEKTGEKYKVVVVDGQKFDCRNGKPLEPPTAYRIEPIEQ